jgi:UDP-N-acetylmuramate--alanine ligase
MLNNLKKIHFVGIGGIGMSGLAKVLLEMGYEVTGSDAVANSCVKQLGLKGAKISLGHSKHNLDPEVGLVVYSSSIPKDNPELLEAKRREIPVLHRADILADLMSCRIGIAVAGAHGKTTTTAMIAHILDEAGLEPTAVVGGWVNTWNTNAILGKGNLFIAESDESDGSFLKLSPVYTVVNNIDEEHFDYYRNIDNAIEAYRNFIENTRDYGCVFYCNEDVYLRRIMQNYRRRNVSYGLTSGADIYAEKIKLAKNIVEFECIYYGNDIGKLRLQVPGLHNVINAEAALAVARELNVSLEIVKKALFSYKGTRRRFQIKKEKPIMIVDDYAHHPSEIKVTLEAASKWGKNRIVTVFQPHRYSRTFYLKEHFADAFRLSDKLVITDIYAAGEKPIPGVNGRDIFKAVINNGYKHAVYLHREEIIPYLLKITQSGDLVLMLGAGDITNLTDELVYRLEKYAH